MKPMTYKELGEKVAEQALDDYLINGKTMREWINILSDNMSVLEQIKDEIEGNMESIIGKYDSSIPKFNMPSYKIERNKAREECISIIDKYR